MRSSSSYIICATPRSGSTLLCEYLMLTKTAGYPSEWFLPQGRTLAVEMFGVQAPLESLSYFQELLAKATTSNGVFGIKMMWPQMQQLLAGGIPGLALPRANLRNSGIFPDLKYIYIRRTDEVAQSISLLMAIKTDYWQRMSESNQAPQSEMSSWAAAALRVDGVDAARPRIRTTKSLGTRWTADDVRTELNDPERRQILIREIGKWRDEIRRQNEDWERFFAQQGVSPLTIEYQDLASDPYGTMSNVLTALDLPDANINLSAARLRPLRDERNELLAAAYRSVFPDA